MNETMKRDTELFLPFLSTVRTLTISQLFQYSPFASLNIAHRGFKKNGKINTSLKTKIIYKYIYST